MTIITKWNYVPDPGDHLSSKFPSMTVPDQTLSLRELLDRHARGLPLMGTNQTPFYDEGEGDDIHLNRLDLADQEDLKKSKQLELNELQNKIAQDKASKNKKTGTKDAQPKKDEGKSENEKEAKKPDDSKSPTQS